MGTYTHIPEWSETLPYLAMGLSLSELILTPMAAPIAANIEVQPARANVEIVATIPDGIVDQRTLYYSTSQGLSTPISVLLSSENEESDTSSIPRHLQEISGLGVDALASLAGVSRMGYYKWLNGGGIRSEHAARLIKLHEVFQTLRNIPVPNLSMFLETEGPLGKPIDLLASNNFDVVIGLAMRSSYDIKIRPIISEEMRQASGLPGRFRPVKRLAWNASKATDVEREDELDNLSPTPLPNEVSIYDDFGNELSEQM